MAGVCHNVITPFWGNFSRVVERQLSGKPTIRPCERSESWRVPSASMPLLEFPRNRINVSRPLKMIQILSTGTCRTVSLLARYACQFLSARTQALDLRRQTGSPSSHRQVTTQLFRQLQNNAPYPLAREGKEHATSCKSFDRDSFAACNLGLSRSF